MRRICLFVCYIVMRAYGRALSFPVHVCMRVCFHAYARLKSERLIKQSSVVKAQCWCPMLFLHYLIMGIATLTLHFSYSCEVYKKILTSDGGLFTKFLQRTAANVHSAFLHHFSKFTPQQKSPWGTSYWQKGLKAVIQWWRKREKDHTYLDITQSVCFNTGHRFEKASKKEKLKVHH